MSKHIFTGTVAPATAPAEVGHHYVDTTNDKHYLSVGTSSSSDWIEVGAGGASALVDLTDVVITSVADNEVIAYDSGTSKYINQTAAEAGLAAASHTHVAADITDFDAEVSNNTDVAANTAARHAAVTVTDSSEIDFTLTGQNITASIVAGSIDEAKLDVSVNASLDLADSASQPGHTHVAANITDFDTEVSNNTDVAANTAARHSAVTLSGTPDYITLSGQVITRGLVDLTTDVTGATEGAIAFGNTDGTLTKDATELFWDNTNKRLGVGTNTPSSKYHFVQNHSTTANITSNYSEINVTTSADNTAMSILGYSIDVSNTHGHSGVIEDGSGGTVGLSAFIDVTGDSSVDWQDGEEQNVAYTSTLRRSGAITGLRHPMENIGHSITVQNDCGLNNASANTSYQQYGNKVFIQSNGTVTAGTLVRNNFGEYITVQSNNGGTTKNYGIYIEQVSGGDENYAFYSAFSTAPSVFGGDVSVPDEAYGSGWNASLEVPTKNAVYDKLESVMAGTGMPTVIQLAISDETTDLTTGNAKVTFRMPYAMTLTAVRASVNTAPTGSTVIVDINESGSTILSTKLSIDASEKTSTTAATAAVMSDTSLADDAEITIDIDQVGSTIAGKGLKLTLIGTRT